ncbi:unnamed protein product [Calypogeia fissa]
MANSGVSWLPDRIKKQGRECSSMNATKKAVLGLSAVGLVVLLLNLVANRPTSVSYGRITREESQLAIRKSSERTSEGMAEMKDSGNDVEYKLKMDAKLWGKTGVALEPCWNKHLPPKPTKKPWGFVVVTTSNGPHNYRAQIADAVVVAAQLGASLIVPTIKEGAKEPNSRFEDIYNVKTFISSLDGVVRVVGRPPEEKENKTFTSIPLRVTKDYIDEKVRPIFEEQGGMVFLGTFLSAIQGEKEDKEMIALRCLVMYKALQYVPAIQKLGDRLISRMREAATESGAGRFVAVELQMDLLRHKACNVTDENQRKCLEPREVGEFLKMMGFPSATAIYLTQSRWNPSLESLLELFPNVHTKEYSMPFNEENQYLMSGKTQFEQAVDFYICSRSDVFVPTVPGLFYAHVAGQRISAGLNHIIVPTVVTLLDSDKPQFMGAISPYVEKRNHQAYRCYCEPSLSAPINKSEEVEASTDLELKPEPVAEIVSKKDESKQLIEEEA